MPAAPDPPRYRFGPFELDVAGGVLTRAGAPVAIQPKPFALLAHLIEQRQRIVSREELRRAVWPGVAVSDAAVASALRDLRRALDDAGGASLQTLRGRGFRFVHPVEVLHGTPAPALPGFVGRGELLEALGRQLDEAATGRGQLAFLVGEAGIGKTRTALELGERARGRGFAVHVGRCLEEPGAPPFRPWGQVLREILGGRAPPALDAETGAALERIWAAPAPARGRAASEGEWVRFALFDAVARALAAASADRPRLLVLDDLHRADTSSLRLLRHVAEELGGQRLLLLGTYRDGALPPDHPLGSALAELHPAGARLALIGLSPAEVADLVRVACGRAASPELAAALHARTNGNPLFVEEIARALAAEGSLGAPDAAQRAACLAPEGTRQVIRGRIARLGSDARAVLEVAAVVGREFEASLVEAGLAADAARVAPALERALAAGLVAEAAPDSFRFLHILVRDALYRELPATRRAALHAAVGRALEQLVPAERDARAAALAYHFQEAVPVGEVLRAVRWAHRAAELALGRAAYDEAVGHAERALRDASGLLRPDPSDPAAAAEWSRARPELLVLLGRAHWAAGATDEARDAFRDASAAARAAGAPDLLARAALGYAGRTDATPGVNRPAVALLEEALAALPERELALRAELLARLGTELYYDGPGGRADALTCESLALAEGLGHAGLLAYALSARHYTLTRPDVHPRERLPLGERLMELAERSGARDTLALGLQERALDLLELGDGLRLDKTLDAHAKVVAELRQPFFRWMGMLFQGMRALLAGRLDEAERHAHEALALGQGFGTPNAVGAFACQLFAVRREQGRLAELEAPLRAMVFEQPELPAFRTGLAALAAETGRPEEVVDALGPLFAGDLEGFPRDQHWLAALSLLAPACVASGNPDFVRGVYEHFAPYDGRMVVVGYGSAANGAVSHHRGVLANALGDADAADDHFEAARSLHRRLGAPLWLAHTQREHARALWKRGTPGDRERARALQAEALAAYERFGLPHRAAQARDLGAGG